MPAPHVLITRPQPGGGQLAELLSASGVESTVLPPYRFRPMATEPLPESMSGPPDRPRLFVFTSPRAVEHGLHRLPAEIRAGALIGAIARSTASALTDAGVEVDLVPEGGFTSEDFLQIKALAENPGHAVVVCAPGGRDALPRGLRALGWETTEWHVYERVPAILPDEAVDRIRKASVLWTVWTSSEAMRLLAGRLSRDAWNRVRAGRWFVLSDRLAHTASVYGVSRPDRLSGPGNSAIHDTLLAAIESESEAG